MWDASQKPSVRLLDEMVLGEASAAMLTQSATVGEERVVRTLWFLRVGSVHLIQICYYSNSECGDVRVVIKKSEEVEYHQTLRRKNEP